MDSINNILENTTDSIWAIDNEYRCLYLNKTFQTELKKTFGIELKKGNKISGQLPEPLNTIWKKKYEKALKGEHCTFEECFPDKNNNTIYIEVTLSPIIINEKITGVTCFGKNITKNKLNEIELQKYSLLLESSLESQKGTILYSIDKDFNYTYFNSERSKIIKTYFNTDIKIGMHVFHSITNIDLINFAKKSFHKSLKGESNSFIRNYGNNKYYESFVNPTKNDKNEIVGVTVLSRDITNRIKEENALKNSEKKLKEIIATKNMFFSLISHDLRGPLGSITALAKLMHENFDDYETTKKKLFLKNICNGLDNTSALLENLLLWSSSQSNAISFQPETIDLSKITNDIIDFYSPITTDKNLIISKDYPEIFEVFADKQMLSTIIRNLLSNAIKFSYNKGIIEIKFEVLNNSNEIQLSICDYGMGISEKNLKNTFNISEGTSTPGTNNEKGTGLGLIICKEFIEKHNGTITFESKINEMTKVNVILPQK